jgi:aspartate kinase
MILPARDSSTSPVAGISGKKPYRNLFIEKLMLSRYPAYREELLGLLREKGIVPEFESRGFDSISFLLSDSAVGDEMELLEMVKSRLEPDEVSFRPPMALIGIVGEGMMEKTGLAADFLGALKSAGINVRFINYGGSEITLLIGVDEAKYAEALRVLVDASKDTA